MKAKVKVTVTTLQGEVLDSAIVSSYVDPKITQNMLSNKVMGLLESEFDYEEIEVH